MHEIMRCPKCGLAGVAAWLERASEPRSLRRLFIAFGRSRCALRLLLVRRPRGEAATPARRPLQRREAADGPSNVQIRCGGCCPLTQ